jgi:uncharacterized HhH-GPD family protein
MYLASTEQANELLERDPLALLIGMLLDQQIPLEKAFTSPDVLRERLGGVLDVHVIAGYDPEEFEAIFRQPPALHRFPAAMAKRVQSLAHIIVDSYDGVAENVWARTTTGTELVRRVGELPGFGEQKAKIFVALLGKQRGITPDGWREAAGNYGDVDSYRSVADIVDADSLVKVRRFKQEMKAKAKAVALEPKAPAAGSGRPRARAKG